MEQVSAEAEKVRPILSSRRPGRSRKKPPPQQSLPTIKCPYCDLTFQEQSSMLEHKGGHEEEFQFECGQCDKLFKDLQSLKTHFYSLHTVSGTQGGFELEGDGSFPVIEGEFLVREYARTGVSPLSTSTVVVGPQVQKQPVQNCKMEELIIAPPLGETSQHKCSICSKVFSSRKALREHQKRHSSDHKFFCQITGCEKGFKTRQDRNRHEIRAHVPPDQRPNQIFCEVCNKRIAHKGVVADHMRNHTNERPFTCHLCGKSFRQANALKCHLQSQMHGGPGLSYRNKKKVRKVTVPKKRGRKPKNKAVVVEKVKIGEDEDESEPEDNDNEMIEKQMPSFSQSGSKSTETNDLINQAETNQFYSRHQQQIPPPTTSGESSHFSQHQHQLWRMQQNPPQLLPNASNLQQPHQNLMQNGENNMIWHMPTLTLHDAYQNAYRS